MTVNDDIIIKFLRDGDISSYSNAWIFHAIEEKQHLFDKPNPAEKQAVAAIYKTINDLVNHFVPYNAHLVSELFPDFRLTFEEAAMILCVGCPNPYDAMVLENNGHEYIVFDLIRFADYGKQGADIANIVRKLLTHELVHMCLHKKYADLKALPYVDKLNYIAFDEGFAHLLAYKENISSCEWDESLQIRFDTAKRILKNAVSETDPEKQAEYFIMADTGNYWEKFASICGKLYLLRNLHKVGEIYQSGWHGFVADILA